MAHAATSPKMHYAANYAEGTTEQQTTPRGVPRQPATVHKIGATAQPYAPFAKGVATPQGTSHAWLGMHTRHLPTMWPTLPPPPPTITNGVHPYPICKYVLPKCSDTHC
jgi:hypothetical protein